MINELREFNFKFNSGTIIEIVDFGAPSVISNICNIPTKIIELFCSPTLKFGAPFVLNTFLGFYNNMTNLYNHRFRRPPRAGALGGRQLRQPLGTALRTNNVEVRATTSGYFS